MATGKNRDDELSDDVVLSYDDAGEQLAQCLKLSVSLDELVVHDGKDFHRRRSAFIFSQASTYETCAGARTSSEAAVGGGAASGSLSRRLPASARDVSSGAKNPGFVMSVR